MHYLLIEVVDLVRHREENPEEVYAEEAERDAQWTRDKVRQAARDRLWQANEDALEARERHIDVLEAEQARTRERNPRHTEEFCAILFAYAYHSSDAYHPLFKTSESFRGFREEHADKFAIEEARFEEEGFVGDFLGHVLRTTRDIKRRHQSR